MNKSCYQLVIAAAKVLIIHGFLREKHLKDTANYVFLTTFSLPKLFSSLLLRIFNGLIYDEMGNPPMAFLISKPTR